MRFRLHSMVAILITLLLLSALAVAQKPAPQPRNREARPAADQDGTPPCCDERTGDPGSSGRAGHEWALSGHEQGRRGPRPADFSDVQPRRRQRRSGPSLVGRPEKARRYRSELLRLSTRSCASAWAPETQMLEENIVPYIFAPDTVYSRLSNFANVPSACHDHDHHQPARSDRCDDDQPVPTVAEGRYAGYTRQEQAAPALQRRVAGLPGRP